jgi:hypothetical protein
MLINSVMLFSPLARHHSVVLLLSGRCSIILFGVISRSLLHHVVPPLLS